MTFNNTKLMQALALGLINIVILLFVNKQTVNLIEQSYLNHKKQEIQNVLFMTKQLIAVTIAQKQEDGFTRKEIEALVTDYLNVVSFDDVYFWANDQNAIARAHIRKDVLGSFQRSYIVHIKGLGNKKIFFETKENINPDSGLILYKINGIVKVDQWDWLIGYGAYLHQEDINRLKNQIMVWVIILALILDIFVLLLIFRRPVR